MVNIKEEALGGLSAGIVGTIIGFPLDLVKTRMQTNNNNNNKSTTVTISRTLKNIVKKEGIGALYKGVGPPLLSLSILNTMTFGVYSELKVFFHMQFNSSSQYVNNDNNNNNINNKEVIKATRGFSLYNALAGASIGPATGCISTPENFIKTQMQMDNLSNSTKPRFTSSLQCASILIKENGLNIIYTGFSVNVVRECVFIGNYFYTYEGLRSFLISSPQALNHNLSPQLAIPIAGGCAGALSWFISFPLDCIRAGVQGQQLRTGHSNNSNDTIFKLRSGISIGKELFIKRGLRGLYSGVTPSIIRAFLVSGTRFSAYELALWLLKRSRSSSNSSSM